MNEIITSIVQLFSKMKFPFKIATLIAGDSFVHK